MFLRGIEEGFSLFLFDRTQKERHQAADMGEDSALWRWGDVRHPPYAEDTAVGEQSHQQ